VAKPLLSHQTALLENDNLFRSPHFFDVHVAILASVHFSQGSDPTSIPFLWPTSKLDCMNRRAISSRRLLDFGKLIAGQSGKISIGHKKQYIRRVV
jgi:hypothetical protein